MRKTSYAIRSTPAILSAFLLGAGLAPCPSEAQYLAKVGGELQINTTTAGSQLEADVVMEDGGTFVVVWRELDQGGIHGQRFDWGGNPVGGELQVAPSNGARPSIVRTLPSGAALGPGTGSLQGALPPATNVLWGDYDQLMVKGRAFAPGAPTAALVGYRPFVDPASAPTPGGYRFAYRHNEQVFRTQHRDVFHNFRSEGELPSAPAIALDISLPFPPLSDIAAGPSTPSYLMSYIWTDVVSGFDIVTGHFFDGDDNPVGAPFQINDPAEVSVKTDLSTAVTTSGVAMAAWRSGQSGPKVVVRFLDSTGPIPGWYLVSSDLTSDLRRPTVAATGDHFIVAWDRSGVIGSSNHIVARFIDASNPLAPIGGPEFAVSGTQDWSRSTPAVTADEQGRAVVVWQSFGQDGDQSGIYAQRLQFVPDGIFLDGFEAGNTSAWSGEVP